MNYDLQQLNNLLSSLELDIEKTTESEKELQNFLRIRECSTNYYVENIDAVNNLLKCCTKVTEEGVRIDKNIGIVYELLRNDLYKYKSKEIKDKNIEFDQIDQLEFFNFLNKLYNDPDFVEKISQKDSTLLMQVKEIQEKLEVVLKHQIEEYFKDPEKFKNSIKDFNFQSKQELYDEAYNRLMHLDVSSCLKNIYYKDSVFTIADDIKLLFQCINTEVVQEQTSKFKKYVKNHFNLDFDAQKDKELLLKLGAVLACSGVVGTFSAISSGASEVSEFFDALKLSFGATALTSSAAVVFSEAFLRKAKETKHDALNEQDVVDQKYKQLEDDAFYSVALAIRYNSDAFEELKSLTSTSTNADEYDRSQIEDLLNNCQYIQKAFEKLKKRVDQIHNQKNVEVQTNTQLSSPYVLTEEVRQTYEKVRQSFQNFSQEDQNKLLRLVQTSKQKTAQISDFIKTSKLFNRDITTVKTFDELMNRLQENSATTQNKAQNYLQKMLEDAEKYSQRHISQQNARATV